MVKIGSVNYGREIKCTYCGGRYTIHYELGESKEDIVNKLKGNNGRGLCSGCFLEWLIDNDEVEYYSIEEDELYI